jgi:hypothetical protein
MPLKAVSVAAIVLGTKHSAVASVVLLFALVLQKTAELEISFKIQVGVAEKAPEKWTT